MLIRAIGPTLGSAPFNISGVLNDPILTIQSSGSVIAANDNWNATDAAVFAGVGAFALQPGSRDAALVIAVAPGGYTAEIHSASDITGIALVEIYELP